MRGILHNSAIDFLAFVPRLFPFSFILCNLSFDSLRTTARDHRQNFCFLSVLRGRPECVERESYFRWVARTCASEPEREEKKERW